MEGSATMRRVPMLLVIVLALLGGDAGADPMAEAQAAVRERRFADAAEIWRELGQRGHPDAQ